ncbi:MAG: 3-deoxy-8-phosphooctulonate synthase [Fidelibacterota bacterium]
MPEQFDPVIFGGDSLPLIAGPCVIENEDHALMMAAAIRDIAAAVGLPFIFKSSFDKANRTSVESYRGPGLKQGLNILARIHREIGVPVLTDIHLPHQAEATAEVVDIIQIPAFLCRQTDLLLAAGKTGKPVNVKRGQFVSPGKMGPVVKKLETAGTEIILLTERGTTFGYDSLVFDVRAIPMMQTTGCPVIFDGTHSAQVPGQGSSTTGGERSHIPTMVRAAVAAGCDGLFLEIHNYPEQALSDAATQWPLDKLESLLRDVMKVREAIRGIST